MAKRKKPTSTPDEPEYPPPLNMSADVGDMMAQMAGCTSISDDPLVGCFTVVTTIGHYDFMINETLANQMVQALREFLRGDSASLIDDNENARD